MIQCLAHIALLVDDLDAARQFYGQVLGLEAAPRSLNYPGLWYQTHAFQIHLIQQDQWEAPRPRPDKWGRNPHLAFYVDNLEAIKIRLERYGHAFQMSSSGRAALFTADADGNIIELTQVSQGA